MTKADFFELVEFKAKAASVFPCVLGSLYAWWHYRQLDVIALIGFFSLRCCCLIWRWMPTTITKIIGAVILTVFANKPISSVDVI